MEGVLIMGSFTGSWGPLKGFFWVDVRRVKSWIRRSRVRIAGL